MRYNRAHVTDACACVCARQVEGAPAVVKKGLKKEEAEALSKVLQASGAKVTLL